MAGPMRDPVAAFPFEERPAKSEPFPHKCSSASALAGPSPPPKAPERTRSGSPLAPWNERSRSEAPLSRPRTPSPLQHCSRAEQGPLDTSGPPSMPALADADPFPVSRRLSAGGMRRPLLPLCRHDSITAAVFLGPESPGTPTDALDKLALFSPSDWVGKLQGGSWMREQEQGAEAGAGGGVFPMSAIEGVEVRPLLRHESLSKVQRRALLRKSRPDALKRRNALAQKNLTMPPERPHGGAQGQDGKDFRALTPDVGEGKGHQFHLPPRTPPSLPLTPKLVHRTPDGTEVRFNALPTLRKSGSGKGILERPSGDAPVEGAEMDAQAMESSRKFRSSQERLQNVFNEMYITEGQ